MHAIVAGHSCVSQWEGRCGERGGGKVSARDVNGAGDFCMWCTMWLLVAAAHKVTEASHRGENGMGITRSSVQLRRF